MEKLVIEACFETYFKAITENILQIPEEKGQFQDIKVPYVIVADNVFPLKTFLMNLFVEYCVLRDQFLTIT